jgi:hypothetical protein
MMVARRTRGAGVRKPPKEETAGGVTKLRVRRRGGEHCRPVATGRTGVAQQRSNDRTAVPGCAVPKLEPVLDKPFTQIFLGAVSGA